jgi:hypothetical protein
LRTTGWSALQWAASEGMRWRRYRDSPPRNCAFCVGADRRTPIICELRDHARWTAGSATSSRFPYAAPSKVPSIGVAMNRHGGKSPELENHHQSVWAIHNYAAERCAGGCASSMPVVAHPQWSARRLKIGTKRPVFGHAPAVSAVEIEMTTVGKRRQKPLPHIQKPVLARRPRLAKLSQRQHLDRLYSAKNRIRGRRRRQGHRQNGSGMECIHAAPRFPLAQAPLADVITLDFINLALERKVRAMQEKAKGLPAALDRRMLPSISKRQKCGPRAPVPGLVPAASCQTTDRGVLKM